VGNIVYFKDSPEELSTAERRARVDEMMMGTVTLVQDVVAQLEQVEKFLTSAEARRQLKQARNAVIDAAVLSCGAISEEFDKPL
jgi:hypothetical protein